METAPAGARRKEGVAFGGIAGMPQHHRVDSVRMVGRPLFRFAEGVAEGAQRPVLAGNLDAVAVREVDRLACFQVETAFDERRGSERRAPAQEQERKQDLFHGGGDGPSAVHFELAPTWGRDTQPPPVRQDRAGRSLGAAEARSS